MRYATLAFGAVGAGVNAAPQQIPTSDDQYDRLVRRIWITPQTAGVEVSLIRTGFTPAVIDAARFAAGNWPAEIDEWWGRTLQIQVSINNTTGSSVSPIVTIAYEAPDNPNGGANKPAL